MTFELSLGGWAEGPKVGEGTAGSRTGVRLGVVGGGILWWEGGCTCKGLRKEGDCEALPSATFSKPSGWAGEAGHEPPMLGMQTI